jgi:hypothetical protein
VVAGPTTRCPLRKPRQPTTDVWPRPRALSQGEVVVWPATMVSAPHPSVSWRRGVGSGCMPCPTARCRVYGLDRHGHGHLDPPPAVHRSSGWGQAAGSTAARGPTRRRSCLRLRNTRQSRIAQVRLRAVRYTSLNAKIPLGRRVGLARLVTVGQTWQSRAVSERFRDPCREIGVVRHVSR